MADLSISNAASLDHSTIATDDLFPVVDVSAATGSKGSKITVDELTTTVNDALRGASNIFTVSGSASTPALSLTGTVFTGGSATTTRPLFVIEPTGTTSTAWSTSGTLLGANAPENFPGKVLDAQIGAKSAFSVDNSGVLIGMPGVADYNVTLRSNWGTLYVNNTVATNFNGDTRYTAINGNGTIQYFALCHDSIADVLALRNGSNAQSLRVYEAYTDASNYARLSFIASAGTYSIKPEAAGTGTLRDLSLGASGGRTLIQSSLLQLGGTTSSYPSLATESGVLQVLLADGSGYASFDAGGYSVGGTPGASGLATGTNTLTIVNGIITNIS